MIARRDHVCARRRQAEQPAAAIEPCEVAGEERNSTADGPHGLEQAVTEQEAAVGGVDAGLGGQGKPAVQPNAFCGTGAGHG